MDEPYHAPLLKSLYGLLMLMPQSDAFRSLNDRLTTVCNLRENLCVAVEMQTSSKVGLNANRLLERFDAVMLQHKLAKEQDDVASKSLVIRPTVMVTPNGTSPIEIRDIKALIPTSPSRPTGNTTLELRTAVRKQLALDLK